MWNKLFWVGWCVWVTLYGIHVAKQINWRGSSHLLLGCHMYRQSMVCYQFEDL